MNRLTMAITKDLLGRTRGPKNLIAVDPSGRPTVQNDKKQESYTLQVTYQF